MHALLGQLQYSILGLEVAEVVGKFEHVPAVLHLVCRQHFCVLLQTKEDGYLPPQLFFLGVGHEVGLAAVEIFLVQTDL